MMSVESDDDGRLTADSYASQKRRSDILVENVKLAQLRSQLQGLQGGGAAGVAGGLPVPQSLGESETPRADGLPSLPGWGSYVDGSDQPRAHAQSPKGRKRR